MEILYGRLDIVEFLVTIGISQDSLNRALFEAVKPKRAPNMIVESGVRDNYIDIAEYSIKSGADIHYENDEPLYLSIYMHL